MVNFHIKLCCIFHQKVQKKSVVAGAMQVINPDGKSGLERSGCARRRVKHGHGQRYGIPLKRSEYLISKIRYFVSAVKMPSHFSRGGGFFTKGAGYRRYPAPCITFVPAD